MITNENTDSTKDHTKDIDIMLEKIRQRRMAFEHLAAALTKKIETEQKENKNIKSPHKN